MQQGLKYRDDKTTKSLDVALHLFSSLANNKNVKAMHNAAMIHYDRREYIQAYTWFKKAAEKGFKPSINNLSKMQSDPKLTSLPKSLDE